MVWQRGRVSAVGAGRVQVTLKPVSTCRDCLRGRGCGAGVFSRLFARRAVVLELDTTVAYRPGEAVMLGVSPAALTRAALMVYGVPVVAFVAAVLGVSSLGAAAGLAPWVQDLAALIAGIAGAIATLLLQARRPLGGLTPVIVAAPCAGENAGPA